MPFMTHSTDTQFINIENAAHGGAFGANSIPEPTEAQRKSGNYKMGRVNFQGLAIAIEQPRGAYRTGIDSETGKRWTSRMAAHYGYISQTKGNDGDGVDCFLGPFLQSETAYVINQFIDGRFDEHKTMLGFPDEDSARNSYLGSYDRGWNGMESIVPLSISQFKWWLKNGDMSQPLRAKNLPQEGLEAMTKRVQWNSDALPYDQTLDQVLYEIRQSDSGENLLLDSISINDIIEDSDGVLALDALVTPFVRLERKMELLRGVMERAGKSVKVESMQISDPFSQRGTANIAVVFELSDGQTVSIYFHNPDVTPKKMAPTDEIISWKWLLNKKDITIVVAPERGQDLNVREVARRIMRLAEKNSPAFARANTKRSERMQNIQGLKDEITALEKELADAQHELEVVKVEAADNSSRKENLQIAVRESLSKMGWKGFAAGAAMTINNYRASGDGNGFKVERLDNVSGTWVDVGMVAVVSSKTADQIADEIVSMTTKAFESEVKIDPISLEGYARISASTELQDKYQDVLDAFFQERIVAVRNALRDLGWNGEKNDSVLGKSSGDTFYQTSFDYKQVGAGKNVVGLTAVVKSVTGLAENASVNPETRITDDLTKTPEQIAKEIDACVPIKAELKPEPEVIEPAVETEATTETQNGESEKILETKESAEIAAAKAFLKSVVDGTSNASDLMKLLDEIEVSAQALIDAGLGGESDELIGGAAEKWAELDQQANG
ncbi:hypothetical protein C8R28_100841 [Nitrosomonas ureae]|uniref:Defence against restriction A N-terminal domain-containing protein n=2 Tax=Nitrosomonas ureae TaxID=44577 RepID=A0A2T5ISP8_9PROT|nr:hypothetical protein C8R28_100841 [Nitrosomonas ureae]